MKQPQYHYLSQYTEPGVIVVTFTKSLLNADAVEEALATVTSAGGLKVVLDCQAVRSLVSGSLYPQWEPFKPLLMLRQKLKEGGGRLVLCNLSPAIEEVFRITRLYDRFEVRPDVAAAVDSLKEQCNPS